MYVNKEEVMTHLYEEQIVSISGGDEEKLTVALNVAISEARGYLTARYDIDRELEKTGGDRNDLLVLWIKDIAVWHFVNVCNVNTSLELRAKRYDDAISQLTKIQKGNFDIALPARVDEEGRKINSTPFAVGSNPRRVSHM
jgi:phage gp36-like protein